MARGSRQGLGGGWWGGWAVAVGVVAVRLVTRRCGVAGDTEFPVPGGLAPAVRFWTDVFTKHGRRDVIIHDRIAPGVVYGVVTDVDGDDDPRVAAAVQAVLDRLVFEALRCPGAR